MNMENPPPGRTRRGRAAIPPAEPLPDVGEDRREFIWEAWTIAGIVGAVGIVGLVRWAQFVH